MAKHDFTLEVSSRANVGKGASRRLRRNENAVPAIIYGGDAAPTNISIAHNHLVHATENEAFFSSIITLDVEGTKESVIIKDMQRHPSKPRIMHADFQRVSADHELHVNVPLHFLNEDKAPGVKTGGGIVSHLMTELEISCLPKDLPAYIEVDLANLGLGESIHISALKLPEGVTSIALTHGEESDHAVVAITAPKGSASDNAEDAAAEEEK